MPDEVEVAMLTATFDATPGSRGTDLAARRWRATS